MNIRQAIRNGLGVEPAQPVKQLRWMFVCPSCGRDNGMTNSPPLRAQCISFGCDTIIEAEDNPDFVLTTVGNPTGDQKVEFVSKMLLTKIEAE